MPNRRLLAALALATFTLVACSGSDSSQFTNMPPEAGPGIQTDAGANLGIDSGANDGPCSPALPTSFSPTWKGPTASYSGACNANQISGFYDACLQSPVSAATCSNFTTANTACAACLQSNDTDPKYGPVIWHDNHTLYTINIAGCIADLQGDSSGAGCASAWQAVDQCEEAACTQCYDPSTGDTTRYFTCEGQADGSQCASFQTTEANACSGDASALTAACRPAPGTSSATAGEDAFLLVAPVFCGGG